MAESWSLEKRKERVIRKIRARHIRTNYGCFELTGFRTILLLLLLNHQHVMMMIDAFWSVFMIILTMNDDIDDEYWVLAHRNMSIKLLWN